LTNKLAYGIFIVSNRPACRQAGSGNMADINIKKYEIEIDPNEPLFVISVVSNMIDIPIWTLRKLDEMGVVTPKRIGKKTRCYSKDQVKKLNYICYLMHERGVNISGIKYILEVNTNDNIEK
jgi:hypothetical protein